MKTTTMVFVRVYVTESSHLLNKIMNYLKNEAHIRGMSVFRAVSGFGDTSSHTAMMVDLSLDLPLAIEFFDVKAKIEPALDYLSQIIKDEHIIFWDVKTNN